MCKFDKKNGNKRIDPCMRELVKHLNGLFKEKYRTVASCCGHGKYPMTLVVRNNYGTNLEIFSGKIIKRKKRLYQRDLERYYYIPEVSKKIHNVDYMKLKKPKKPKSSRNLRPLSEEEWQNINLNNGDKKNGKNKNRRR